MLVKGTCPIGPILINVNHIVTIESDEYGCLITLSTGETLTLREDMNAMAQKVKEKTK